MRPDRHIRMHGHVLALLAVVSLQATAAAQPFEPHIPSDDSADVEHIHNLTDDELLKSYESAAISAGVTDLPFGLELEDFDSRRVTLDHHRGEILRRGGSIVPELLQLLRSEVTRQRPAPDGSDSPPGLVKDILELLAWIGDPRPVEPLLDMAVANDGETATDHYRKLRAFRRRYLLHAIMKLTYVRFHHVQPFWEGYDDAVPHPTAIARDRFEDEEVPKAVKLYRDWLASEGKEPAQWLPLAQKRAHQLLEGGELDAAYCAARFLAPQEALTRVGVAPAPMRDDDPGRTLQRLGQILAGARRSGNDKQVWQYNGHPLPVPLYNWVGLLASYGPRARPWSKTLIRLQEASGLNAFGGWALMARVGGKELVAYSVATLPKLSAQVEALQKDPDTPKGFSGNDPRGWWFSALRECRWGIDRWAGRVFDTDAQRLAWWKANKEKSPEQWLRDSLPEAARRADAGGGLDDELFRRLVPEYMAKPSSRAEWVQENLALLEYDASTGAFRRGL